MEPEVVVKW